MRAPNLHDLTDRRILAFSLACVEKIERAGFGPDGRPQGPLVDKIRRNIDKFPESHRAQWQALSRLPWAEFKAVVLARGDSGNQLRQNIPFAGILNTQERLAIFNRHRFSPRPSVSAP
jgi:hypothetical protein